MDLDSPTLARTADTAGPTAAPPTATTPPNAGRQALNVVAAVVLVFGPMLAGLHAYDTPWVRFAILLLPVGLTIVAAARKSSPARLAILFTTCAVFCGMIIGLQSAYPAHFVDDALPTLATVSAAALFSAFMVYSLRPGAPLRLSLAASLAKSRKPPGRLAGAVALLLACAAAGGYGFGVFTALDEDFDQAAPQTFHATVQSKHYTSHRGGGTYTLRLSRSSPFPAPDDVDVASGVYHQLAIGQTACVALHPGLLGARWFSIARC